ncbi:hypothetical protein [Pedobacter mendelii]|uniref:Universal stress protein family protein n=1 Tax=Pedobacter mendelii TaxID=1908240 RepID=A0ABQ2BKU8_9SPHI|nr:hypothetical protein [Pedobacter mendelii]GGI26464.1 hypothetical protein GCM10008119_22790 [Pedobacter mendelii]
MKTILIINDNTPEAEHAAVFALILAQRLSANIILASNPEPKHDSRDYEWAGSSHDETIAEPIHTPLMKKLLRRKKLHPGFSPLIQEVEVDMQGLSLLPLRNDIYMVVKGMDEFLPQALLNVNLAINNLLNQLQIPLLLVPSSWSENEFTRLVYLTDLRFCGIETVRCLAGLAGCWKANLVIAHNSASGLPEIEMKEAENIFNQEVSLNVGYTKLFLNMLDKNDELNTLEIMVSGTQADLLVMVNQHFHFNTLTKQYFKDKCALYKPVPLLIFPS